MPNPILCAVTVINRGIDQPLILRSFGFIFLSLEISPIVPKNNFVIEICHFFRVIMFVMQSVVINSRERSFTYCCGVGSVTLKQLVIRLFNCQYYMLICL